MDVVSMLIGFLAGTATGAAGTYFADKYTDQRREKQKNKTINEAWEKFEGRFPLLAKEMVGDFMSPDNQHVRTFFVKHSKETVIPPPEPFFEYHTDVHKNIYGALHYLADHGFVSDITPGNCPKYLIHEKLSDLLIRLALRRRTSA